MLSLIIPAYRQGKTIAYDIHRVKKVLDDLSCQYEIIVVVDGKVDNTYSEAKKVASKHIHVYQYPTNHGKGFAVRYGMAKSKGTIIGFMDAGMDLNPKGLSMMLEHFSWYNADVIVGSKLHPASKVHYPWQRRILSFCYRWLVKLLFGLTIRDTQVGMKIFRRKVLEDVLPRLLVKTYAFDIEILAVAYRLGYRRIYESPVELDFTNVSSITSGTFWRVISHMTWDTLAVFYRLRIKHYYHTGNKRKCTYDPELNFRINLP